MAAEHDVKIPFRINCHHTTGVVVHPLVKSRRCRPDAGRMVAGANPVKIPFACDILPDHMGSTGLYDDLAAVVGRPLTAAR